ncbi:MAG: hypothetical protein HEQ39_09810 [Rhizobacter sp.]
MNSENTASLESQAAADAPTSETDADAVATLAPQAAAVEVVIKPTIGRRVWYWPSEFERTTDPYASNYIAQNDTAQPLDAGIAYVWSDFMVNLTVADQNGVMHARTSVRLLQPGEPAPVGSAYAEWMSYQQGQAKA